MEGSKTKPNINYLADNRFSQANNITNFDNETSTNSQVDVEFQFKQINQQDYDDFKKIDSTL